MALFHPASRRWADRHFVLTKSGFLHWFTSAEELEPLDALALHRCQFESSSEDATITIAEVQGHGVAYVRSTFPQGTGSQAMCSSELLAAGCED